MAFRAFISVDLPEVGALTVLVDELRRTGSPLKLVDLSQVHLTLKFLGDTEEPLVPRIADVIRSSVAGLKPFLVRLEGTGAFPNLRRPKVLWVGMAGAEPLVEIARRLEAGAEPLGYPREGRAFSPHITIARLRASGGLDAVRQVIEARTHDTFGEVLVDRVRLKKSVLAPAGPVYSTVVDVPL